MHRQTLPFILLLIALSLSRHTVHSFIHPFFRPLSETKTKWVTRKTSPLASQPTRQIQQQGEKPLTRKEKKPKAKIEEEAEDEAIEEDGVEFLEGFETRSPKQTNEYVI